jgi:ubiquinone/menaquinone biosynthesis C-methylase UbiE
MARQGAAVCALDFSLKMLAVAREKANGAAIEFIHHDLSHPLPFASASFDLVTCHLVTDHIADLQSLFSEMCRVCRAPGMAINTNMHPAMHLRDVTARFIDPATGQRVPIETEIHTISKYVMAALNSGMEIDHLSEHRMDAELAASSPRSQNYIGWPILMVMRLRTRRIV